MDWLDTFMGPGSRRRATAGLFLFLLAAAVWFLLGVSSASATAPNLKYNVVNTAGIPQADVNVYDANTGQVIGQTNGAGHLTLSDCTGTLVQVLACQLSLAQHAYYYSRSEEGSTDPCAIAPEGWPGTPYTSVSGNAVVIPTVPGTAYQPALSNEELGLVGAINQERVANGLTPVTISSVLTASADKYLSDLPDRPLDPTADSTYCMASGPGIRAVDAGFPTTDDINEDVLQNSPNAYTAMTSLENFDNAGLLGDTITMIGIAQEGDRWVVDTSDLPANDPYYKRAGDTGNQGDYSLVAAEFPVATDDTATDPSAGDDGDDTTDAQPASSPAHGKASQLKFAAISSPYRKHLVQVRLTLAKKAKGTIRVVAVKKTNRKSKVILHSKRNKNKVRVWGRLSKGTWIIKAHFLPTAGTRWQALTIRHIIHVR